MRITIRAAVVSNLKRYGLSCGLLLVPALAWNVALAARLPAAFAPAEFWREIPAGLAGVENLLRVIVFTLPFLMPLELAASGQRRALQLYVGGTAVYFASWVALILAPTSAWSVSAIGFTAPAWTPLFWLVAIGLLGRRLFWGDHYRRWMLLTVSVGFLAAHIGHTALVFSRQP